MPLSFAGQGTIAKALAQLTQATHRPGDARVGHALRGSNPVERNFFNAAQHENAIPAWPTRISEAMWPVKGSCNLTGVGRERAGELKHPGAPIFSRSCSNDRNYLP
jgi:hypothetical protein